MPIHFRCGACQRTLSIATRKAGTMVHCPRCNAALNVPAASEAVIAKSKKREKATVAVEPQTVTQALEAMPLFERPDFESLLNPLTTKGKNVPPLPPPVEMLAPPALPETASADVQELEGIVVSRSKLTWIAVAVATLLVASFAIGYYLAAATIPAKKPARVLTSPVVFCG